MDYHQSKFQMSWLSGSNFMEISVRREILPLYFGNDVIMISFIIVQLLNLRIL